MIKLLSIFKILLIQLTLLSIPAQPTDTFLFDINKLKIPMGNDGTIGAYSIGEYENPVFDSMLIFYSAGFYLTGLINDSLIGSSNFATYFRGDYLPGRAGGDVNDPKNKFYTLRKDDPVFSESWAQWSDAVEQGADFYDGDGNGKYDPVDKNGNNRWDKDEDRPGLIGDLTAWCVFNDAVESDNRWSGFKAVEPVGINIEQTMFGFNSSLYSEVNNVVFVRYVIENNGMVTDVLDSAYFGVIVDTDIGFYEDDLAGCIPSKNVGYAYNDGEDNQYGDNPPAFFVDLLEGPHIYEPGKTFTDVNNNGEYDFGDVPLDTAFYGYGPFIGKKKFPGAVNLNMRSFLVSFKHPTVGSPYNPTSMNNLLLGGKTLTGDSIFVSSWPFGNGDSLGTDTSKYKSRFMYSGNPVLSEGWLNNDTADCRILLSMGPFNLEKNKSQEVLVAYVVGRGDNPLSSITRGIEIDSLVQMIYENNFTDIVSSVDDNRNKIIKDYQLFQNYPNPFNPTTTIKFTIPSNVKRKTSDVRLVVYDILGRKIKSLLNKEMQPGSHEVSFDGSNLSSGIYFYTLTADNFTATKKLMLVK